jgi:Zn-dependent M28 family amino/carboxypeptidase
VTIQGVEPGKVVIGAHYDFTDLGCGAIDNWTGIVAMAHAYGSVHKLGTKKTTIFVAFGNEEKGLHGSKGMAQAIPKSEIPEYCAVINIDSFGLALPFAFKEVSSPKLTALVEDRAAGLKIPFNQVSIPDADADSSSFLVRNIPAVTLSGLTSGWGTILHTIRDQAKAVDSTSVYLGYRLALATWAMVDTSPCDAYNDEAPSLLKQK